MSWLTWRQHRQQALLALVGLAALTALLIPTGREMHAALGERALSHCLATVGPGQPGCSELVHAFSDRFRSFRVLAVLLVFVPLLLGMFFGAPLVARELEHGTHRLVWTQGVTRLRWALVKIGLVGGLAVAFALGYTLLLDWWMTPLNRVNTSRLEPGLFDMQGLVPVGYTLFAVALGVLAGTFTRRVLPAMAATLFGFVAVRLVIALLARPHFLPPLHRTVPAVGGEDPTQAGDWIISTNLYDATGHRLTADAFVLCPRRGACADKFGGGPLRGAYDVVALQPAGRFWTFQAIETGLYVALAAALLAFAVHRIRRRVA